jgi:hypothetical protein
LTQREAAHQYFSYIVAATIVGGQYFSYIVAATIIGGGNWNTSRKLILSLKTALNTLCHTRRENIELTTYVVTTPPPRTTPSGRYFSGIIFPGLS